MINPNRVLGFLFLCSTFSGLAQQGGSELAKKAYTTQKITATDVPLIDGFLTDQIWQTGNWATDFIQYTPHENRPPSEPTTFKIVYDAKFLYIGIRCFDSSPAQINRRMSRRDGYEGDWISVLIDSYHDLRSAFSFTVTSAGDKGDQVISLNGGHEDNSWDPIWYGKSRLDDQGWTAEMKIPLSQLRFGDSKQQKWGLQIVRRLFRQEEKSVWQRVPIDASGWVSEFGELDGLLDLKPQRQLEIQPFLVSSLQTFQKEPLNPYRDHHPKRINAGLDGKIGVTNNLTLDFTINPDFGQVEADPAAIALDGFQLFFREQRPFFIENKNIFNYEFSAPIIGGTFSSDNLFYSRRIGRSPQGSVAAAEGEYINAPERTTILGAVKFSGKTKKGLSIGIMESVTANEYATVNNEGNLRDILIEPLTNYFVGRIQQDFNNRNTFLGGILTSTERKLTDEVDFLHRSALTGGIDFKHQWNNRTWYLGANLVMSQVKGSAEAIRRTQTSIQHLYHRVDAGHLKLTEEKTSLSGTGGDLRFGKAGQGHVKFETGLTWRTPGLELNDIGFMREADEIQNYLGLTYSSLKPFGIFRSGTVGYRHWSVWDFEGNYNYFDWDVEVNGVFNNNWSATFGIYSQPHIYSKSLLRGGPRVRLADQYGAWWAYTSDQRKKIYFGLDGWTKMGGAGAYYLFESGIGITYRPINQFSASILPRYTQIRDRLQYNNQLTYGAETRYISSLLDRETLSLSVRLNYTVHSKLSIQYYGAPYISVGKYKQFSYIVNALAKNQQDQLYVFGDKQLALNESATQYLVDEDGDGLKDYSFANPDFSFVQFRSNLVLRYEYRPGSELFLVWSQGITDSDLPLASLRNSFNEQLLQQQPENIFLIKTTFRFIK